MQLQCEITMYNAMQKEQIAFLTFALHSVQLLLLECTELQKSAYYLYVILQWTTFDCMCLAMQQHCTEEYVSYCVHYNRTAIAIISLQYKKD
jgi:hypothetical protein